MFNKGDILRMKETDFQMKALIPLFRKMGFRDVTAFGGGILERGKDIVMWKDSELGQRLNYGVVVKAKKITGNAEKSEGAMNVLNQVRQMLKTSYQNPVTGGVERIQRVYVANCKDITKEAMFSIQGELENELDKLVEWIHPGSNLFDLIEFHLPELTIFERLSNLQADLDKSMEDTPYRIIASTDNSFSIVEKEDGASARAPFVIKGQFEFDTKTPEGKEAHQKVKDHFEKGMPVEIDGRFLKGFEFPDFVPEWLQPTITPESKLRGSQYQPGHSSKSHNRDRRGGGRDNRSRRTPCCKTR
jgi:hypothetical protein